MSTFNLNRDCAIAAYTRFIDQDVGKGSSSPPTEHNPNDNAHPSAAMISPPNCWATRWRPGSRKTLTDLIVEACQRSSVTEQDLRDSSALRHLTKAWIAYQAALLRIASVSEVARQFNRTEAALRHSVKRHFNYP